MTKGHRVSEAGSKNEGTGKMRPGSAKSALHEICVANKWKPPLYECCEEEGPSHMKKYTFKVTLEIRQASNSNASSTNTVLECFSAPQSRKKIAADHAAEGALWYLNHLGYFPKESQ